MEVHAERQRIARWRTWRAEGKRKALSRVAFRIVFNERNYSALMGAIW